MYITRTMDIRGNFSDCQRVPKVYFLTRSLRIALNIIQKGIVNNFIHIILYKAKHS